ncbi:MAG: hypothetical protein HOK81_14935 [Rhodospirillaceae bacterium]|jgi:hypothetical protein|nr:hypothetical protein [Rhodospirillaceae bacterium]
MEAFTGLFPAAAWLVALLFAGAAMLGGPRPIPARHAVERLIQGILYFPVGIQGLLAFVGHVFLPAEASADIGWTQSPFEFEVGVANLGLALTGIVAVRAGPGFRFAVALFALCFLGGAGVGHIGQFLTAGDTAPGNTGAILATDFLTPFALLILLRIQQRIGPWASGEDPLAP